MTCCIFVLAKPRNIRSLQFVRSMSLWVGCQATSSCVRCPGWSATSQTGQGNDLSATVMNGSTVGIFVTFCPSHGKDTSKLICPVISRPGPVILPSLSLSQAATMADQMAFLLFGDQSLIIRDCLIDFFAGPSRGILCKSFLERSASALREELDRLSNVDRRRIPTFTSIQELNERYHSGTTKNAGLESALLCVTQLALYLE